MRPQGMYIRRFGWHVRNAGPGWAVFSSFFSVSHVDGGAFWIKKLRYKYRRPTSSDLFHLSPRALKQQWLLLWLEKSGFD